MVVVVEMAKLHFANIFFLAACPRWAVGAAGSSSRCANSCLNFIFWLGWVKVKTYDGDNGDGEINLLYQALVIPLV